MTQAAAATAAAPSDLVDALATCHAQPLWDRYHRVTRRLPAAADAPWHWRWTDMEPLIGRACAEVSMEDAERRVLLLTHPAFAGAVATTTNLSSGLQTLLPGEVARPHRHALQAIRYVMEGAGAVTSVNDHRCAMEVGDLVLTPAWTWHEHIHPGSGRVVWFDGLDLPLCTQLDSMFFEIATPGAVAVEALPTRPASLRSDAVPLAPDACDAALAGASRYRFSGERAREALRRAPARADGSRLLRYVDGVSAGAVLPTLDCYLMGLAAGQATRRCRSTSNAVCVVASGSGRSVVADTVIAWTANDVFTLPHWNWISHTATSQEAVIFMMTDRELMACMGYLREEESEP